MARTYKKKAKNDKLWMNKYDLLVAYKAKFGDCRVPQHWAENKQLGNWVSTQRISYKNFKANKKSTLTPERIAKLTALGFDWVVDKWTEMYDLLVAYKAEFGDVGKEQKAWYLGE